VAFGLMTIGPAMTMIEAEWQTLTSGTPPPVRSGIRGSPASARHVWQGQV
jgi:hypothetical protein